MLNTNQTQELPTVQQTEGSLGKRNPIDIFVFSWQITQTGFRFSCTLVPLFHYLLQFFHYLCDSHKMFSRLIPFGFFEAECKFISGPQWLLVPKTILSPPSQNKERREDLLQKQLLPLSRWQCHCNTVFLYRHQFSNTKVTPPYCLIQYVCTTVVKLINDQILLLFIWRYFNPTDEPLYHFHNSTSVPTVLTFARSCHFADGVGTYHSTTAPLYDLVLLYQSNTGWGKLSQDLATLQMELYHCTIVPLHCGASS